MALGAAAVVLALGAAAWAFLTPVHEAPVPDPVFAVAPGRVPVAPVTWRQREGALSVVVPLGAVAEFGGAAQPRDGAGRHFIQVLRPDPVATRRERLAGSPDVVRYRVEVRAVRVRPVGRRHVAISGVGASELVIARYVYPLGTGDLVAGEAVSMRELELPQQPPAVPVVVQLVANRTAVEVRVPAGGVRRATLLTVSGEELSLRRDGAVLVARIDVETLGESAVTLLARDERPTLNIGWLRAAGEDGELLVDAPVRL